MRNKRKKKIVVAVSGYFDPLHVGHIDLFNGAKRLGDELIVIVNNDKQTAMKKGKPFMRAAERVRIIKELRMVDKVVQAIDKDKTVTRTLKLLKPDVFANGGDRHQGNIPEYHVCKKLKIDMLDNIGGEKKQSSSALIRNSQEETIGYTDTGGCSNQYCNLNEMRL